jgi:hypothetical protein
MKHAFIIRSFRAADKKYIFSAEVVELAVCHKGMRRKISVYMPPIKLKRKLK